jgi:hypothetical protein
MLPATPRQPSHSEPSGDTKDTVKISMSPGIILSYDLASNISWKQTLCVAWWLCDANSILHV